MKKLCFNLFICLSICLSLITLTSCKSCIEKLQIKDENGESDFSLVHITDNDMINSQKVAKYKSVINNINNKTIFKAEMLSGVEKFKTIKVNNQTLKINMDIKIVSGNMRVVLIKDKTIIYDFKLNEVSSYEIASASGTYTLVLGGETANFNLSCEVEK